jgi:hypothetical protein
MSDSNGERRQGATTFSIMTLSITVKLCCYAECHLRKVSIMLSVIILSVVMLSVIILSVVMLSVIIPSDVMLNVVAPIE